MDVFKEIIIRWFNNFNKQYRITRMSRISRGTPSHKRVRARNYTKNQAQKRLTETVAPFNKQTENSLYVNAVEVDYYQIQDRTGIPCTCEKTEVLPQHNNLTRDTNIPPVIPTQQEDSSVGLGIELQDDDLFGDSRAEKVMNSVEVDVSGDTDGPFMPDAHINEEPEGNTDYTEGMFLGSNVDCGICYRAGFLPGYKAYGKQRHVLTNYDITGIKDYLVDSTASPHTIKKQVNTNKPYVEFVVLVPKYFASAIFSIRNNDEILRGASMFDEYGQIITMETLRTFAGNDMTLRIKEDVFTHVVIEFDMGNDKLLANIGTESQTLDYNLLETISNLAVVLPPSLHEVRSGDVMVIKNRRLALKVIDKERKITSDQRRLEWVVQTRVLQPTEHLKHIAEGYKLIGE